MTSFIIIMTRLEEELHRLAKPEPNTLFCREAKNRLMHRIEFYENESLFSRFFKTVFKISPSQPFMQAARIRLLSRIPAAKQPVFGWFLFMKRAAATTLVMTLAVTSTLFFVGGKQPVIASENTFLEVLAGEVTIKHADQLIWDAITEQTELTAGDLIRLGHSASAIIHFFDDTQLRISENSTLLLSRLEVSPTYARQGVIEVSLHQGRAWVQTLNVDDGYARFSLVTRDAIIASPKASFDVSTNLFEPTTIRVFKHSAEVSALREDTRTIFARGKLNSYQTIRFSAVSPYQRQTELAALAPITELMDEDRNETWVEENLTADRNHLADLRERELVHLRMTTGTLPGQLLYPLKRAKERLNLAFTFNGESQASAHIDMANQRLNEAIVLIEQGETEKARLALMEYQSLVRHITEASAEVAAPLEQLSDQIVRTHQKTLVAALPGDAHIGMVKQVLDETQEFLTDNPVDRTTIRLQNGLEDLVHVQDLVEGGDLEGAKDTLVSHELLTTSLLEEAGQLEDEEQKKALYIHILEAQYEEQRLLAEISRSLAGQPDDSFIALVANAHTSLTEEIKHTAAVVQPLIPDVVLSQAVILPEDEKVMEFVNKVNIYKTAQGQKNQIKRLLSKHPHYIQDQVFLEKVRDKLNARAQDEINVYLLDLKREAVEAKSKVVKRKIDQAVRAREQRE